MTLLLDVAQLILETPPPLPASTSPANTVDPNAMYQKDWWTIGVALLAGFGGAFAAARTQKWKAEHDVGLARDSALWEYHRVLTDISADISAHMGDAVEGYDDGTFRARIREARKAAYPYFQLFPQEDQLKLKYPTSNSQYPQELHEVQSQVDSAINALDSFLTKK